MSKERVLLWLDDVRDPFEDDWLNFSCLDGNYNVVWVKNYEEFTLWVRDNGLPDGINFDHDLADEHYTPKQYWSDYKEKTGLDCAKWLVDYCMDYSVELPRWYSHSANPVGRDNINAYLVGFLKQKENERLQK